MTLLAIAAIIALGTAATASAILIPTSVQAESCNKVDTGQSFFGCHGCQFNEQGYQSSNGKCHHHEFD